MLMFFLQKGKIIVLKTKLQIISFVRCTLKCNMVSDTLYGKFHKQTN